MYRQGDVLIQKAEIPAEAKRQMGTNGRHVLAEGEATGHAHAVRAQRNVQMFLLGTVMYLRALREVEIEHEEHDTINLPAGDYLIKRQREYTPEEIRNVAD